MSGYTEDHLIEQPAIQLMEHELRWDSLNACDEPPSEAVAVRVELVRVIDWDVHEYDGVHDNRITVDMRIS